MGNAALDSVTFLTLSLTLLIYCKGLALPPPPQSQPLPTPPTGPTFSQLLRLPQQPHIHASFFTSRFAPAIPPMPPRPRDSFGNKSFFS